MQTFLGHGRRPIPKCGLGVAVLLMGAALACGGVDSKPDAGQHDAGRDAAQNVPDAAADAAVELDAGLDAGFDASVDAGPPPEPPVVNGQSADLVLGQPDFVSVEARMGYDGMAKPTGLSANGDRLWVGDSGHDRVLQWDTPPDANGTPAQYVIGQTGPNTHEPGPSAVLLGQAPSSNFISVAGLRAQLLATDATTYRVPIWSRIPRGDGAPADLVLGQASLDQMEQGLSASRFRPNGIWSDGARVVLSERAANRVLIWNHFPLDSDVPADLVLGQVSFETADSADPPNASSMANPAGVFFDGEHLWVADQGNNRVLAWNGFPEENGTPADFVVGQADFSGRLPNAGDDPGPQGMAIPRGVIVTHDSLFVADGGNGRVLVYTPVPTESGVEASAVLGKPNFTTIADVPPDDASMSSPDGVTVVGDSLFVADREWNRVLRFALRH